MKVCILGISAGGGMPQWNCRCQNCLRARRHKDKQHHCHASVAVSGSLRNWCLINPTPDVTNQIENFGCLHPRQGMRSSPIMSILLTDGELDHTLGLLSLRQGCSLNIYAPTAVVDVLTSDFPVRRIVNSYANHRWRRLEDGQQIYLECEGLKVTVIAVGTKLPRYCLGGTGNAIATVAYLIEDVQSGNSLLYAPSVQQWTEPFESAARKAQCVMIDGTFWTDDELREHGISERTASDMGHLSLSAKGGILSNLSRLPAKAKFLVHINNTNKVLSKHSEERRTLLDQGVMLAPEGEEIIV